MKRISLAYLLDVITLLVIGFIISFIFVNFYIDGIYRYVLSFFISLLSTLILGRVLYKKMQKKGMLEKNKKQFGEIMLQLNINSRIKNDGVFFKAYQKANENIEKVKQGVLLKDKNTVVFTRFTFEQITKSEIVKIFNSLSGEQKAIIYTEKFSSEVKEFSGRFGGRILLLDGNAAYQFLEKNQALPSVQFKLYDGKEKPVFSHKNIFLKKRAKTFLCFGSLFLALSYFVPLKIYYVICGSVMLCLSSICIVFGRTSNPKSDQD